MSNPTTSNIDFAPSGNTTPSSTTKGMDDFDFEELTSVVSSSVEEDIQIMRQVCGVDLGVEFLADLETVLREKAHTYRMFVDRQREMSRIGAAHRVKQVSEVYETMPMPLPFTRSNVVSGSPSTAPPQAPLVPATPPPPKVTELSSLRRQGLVSSICSSFRSRLESIVGTQAVSTTGAGGARSRVRANDTGAQDAQIHPQSPPPPPTATSIPSQANRAPSRSSSRAPSPVPTQYSDVRAADEVYMDQLLPSDDNTQGNAMFRFTEEEQNAEQELYALLQFQVATRVLSSRFRSRLENVLQGHMVRQNITPTRLSLPRTTRPPPPTFSETVAAQHAQQHQPQPIHQHRHQHQHQHIHQPQQQHIPQAAQQQQPRAATTELPPIYGMSRDSALWQMSQDMNWLRLQMQETRRLTDTSLAMQMEMQRALRQEVSALFELVRSSHPTMVVPEPVSRANASNATTATGPTTTTTTTTTTTIGKCVVCADQPADVVFFRCGHQCSCLVCATQCKTQKKNCPICRAPIEDFVRCFPAWC